MTQTLQPSQLSNYAGQDIDPVSFSMEVDHAVADGDATGSTGDVSFLSPMPELMRTVINAVSGLLSSS